MLTFCIGLVILIVGAMHDYFSGMICLRDGGSQMPEMIKKYTKNRMGRCRNLHSATPQNS